MRTLTGLAVRNLKARRTRASLTALGVVLGVGMILGVLLLSQTLRSSFTGLFDAMYGKTDLVVSGKSSTGAVRQGALERVRRTPGVKIATGAVFGTLTRVTAQGEVHKGGGATLNTVGIDPAAPDMTGSTVVAGRRLKGGDEIVVQGDWAKANDIKVGRTLKLAGPTGTVSFRVVGTFRFSTPVSFGGQGFASIPISTARRVLDIPKGWSEIDVALNSPGLLETVRRDIKARLGKGVEVATPRDKGEDIESQLQAFNIILYFFAGMALFVGGFLILNSFTMTVAQRVREIGMLRTLGAGRRRVTALVLREAVVLGVLGSIVGLGLGVGLAFALTGLLRSFGFPIGGVTMWAPGFVVAFVVGMVVTLVGALIPAIKAGRIPPIQAVLGGKLDRGRPGAARGMSGVVLLVLGAAGVWMLARSTSPSQGVVAAGLFGIVGAFVGVALVAPFAIGPIVTGLAWPLRRLRPVEGRLASDSLRSNPSRSAATASSLMIGLALVTAFGALGSSFLGTIDSELDSQLKRDYTVQPRNFAPGQGPQQQLAGDLVKKIRRVRGVAVATPQRFLFVPHLYKGTDAIVFGFDPRVFGQVDDSTFQGGVSEKTVERAVQAGEVTVGVGLAKQKNIKRGQTVNLEGPSGRLKARVAAIVDTTVFGGQTVGMSFSNMSKTFGVRQDSTIAVKAVPGADLAGVERRIDAVLKPYPQVEMLSNAQLKADIDRRVDQQFGFFNAILLVAILVSLLGIVNTLTMNVMERTREIGVLRALGASRWLVRRAVVSEGILLALAGTALGLLVGIVLGYVLVRGSATNFPALTYHAPYGTIAAVAVAGVVLGTLAAVLPARRAARMNVIEAIHFE